MGRLEGRGGFARLWALVLGAQKGRAACRRWMEATLRGSILWYAA